MNEPRTGVLLVNLGTPDSPAVGDVRRYLREFLGDPRVLDMPALARWLLLNFVILPVRPRTTARAYAQVWTPQGSPLRVHGEALRDGVAQALGPDYVVALGMRYGEPSIAGALEQLCEADVARVLALPLFPHYSEAATGSAVAKIHEELARGTHLPPIEMQGAFYADPGFIASFAEVARPQLEEFRPDFVLFSYHGLPEHQVRACDKSGSHCLERSDCCDAVGEVNRLCYRAHCFATTRALSAALGLDAERHSVAFQSRLGRQPWIQPFTDHVLPDLATRGIRRLAVLCPSFVADCLETIEEIGIRGRDQWLGLGGEELRLVPSLNAEPKWVETVARWMRHRA